MRFVSVKMEIDTIVKLQCFNLIINILDVDNLFLRQVIIPVYPALMDTDRRHHQLSRWIPLHDFCLGSNVVEAGLKVYSKIHTVEAVDKNNASKCSESESV